jgi:hypothetical protein
MRIFGPIVQPFALKVFDIRHDLPLDCGMGTELAGDSAPGLAALLGKQPYQPTSRGLSVLVYLHNLVDHGAI